MYYSEVGDGGAQSVYRVPFSHNDGKEYPEFSKKEFLIRAGIEEKNLAVFLEMDNHFAEYVFGQKQKECYLKNYRQTVIRQTMRLI